MILSSLKFCLPRDCFMEHDTQYWQQCAENNLALNPWSRISLFQTSGPRGATQTTICSSMGLRKSVHPALRTLVLTYPRTYPDTSESLSLYHQDHTYELHLKPSVVPKYPTLKTFVTNPRYSEWETLSKKSLTPTMDFHTQESQEIKFTAWIHNFTYIT